MSNDEKKALSIDEIILDLKNKPKVDRPKDFVATPKAVGFTGLSLGHESKPRTYNRDTADDEEIPNGATIGARISNTR